MSSASGIQVSAGLKRSEQEEDAETARSWDKESLLETARRMHSHAFIKVQIVHQQLESVHEEKKGGGLWSSDFDLIARHLDATVPCFIIFFQGRDQLSLLQYTPEDASPRDKMAYSASKGALSDVLNARSYGASFNSNGRVQSNVSYYFGSSKSDFTSAAYSSHRSVAGPRSEVEEALQALPRALDKKEFNKSMGYSLLANVSGKQLPPQLAGYGMGQDSGSSASSSSVYRSSGPVNIYAKPSQVKAANAAARSQDGVKKTMTGGPVLPGWGQAKDKQADKPAAAAAAASPTATAATSNRTPAATVTAPKPTLSTTTTSTPSSSAVTPSVAPATSPVPAASPSSSSPSPSFSPSSSAPARVVPVPSGKCLASGCSGQRVKQGYCQPCLDESERKRKEAQQKQQAAATLAVA